MKKIIGGILRALIFPTIYLVMQLTVSAIFSIVLGIYAGMTFGAEILADADAFSAKLTALLSENTQWIMLIVCIMATLIALRVLKMRGSIAHELSLEEGITLGQGGLLTLIGFSLYLFTVMALEVLPIPESMWAQYEELVSKTVITDNILLTTLTTALAVPLTEEIIFRGLSFGALKKVMPVGAAVILQALIFSGAHLVPVQMLYVLPAALVLGIVFVWTGSFAAPLALHIIYNGTGVFLSYLPSNGAAEESAGAGVWIWLAGSFVVFAVSMLLLYRTRAANQEAGEDPNG